MGAACSQQAQPGGGQRSQRAAAVVVAGAARHQAGPHQAVDAAGQAAPGEEQSLGQLRHAQRPLGRLGEVHQHLVFPQRQAGAQAQFPIEALPDPVLNGNKPAPHPLLARRQPLDWLGNHQPTRLSATSVQTIASATSGRLAVRVQDPSRMASDQVR